MKDPERLAWWLALAIVGLAVPLYALGWWNAPSGMRFTGSIVAWSADASYHMTWPRQAADGAWLFEDKFNGARVHSRLIFNWYFLALGLVARLLGTHPIFVWYAAQAALVLLAVRLTLALGERFFPEARWRSFFVVVALFGGGLGWLRPLLPGFRPNHLIDLERVETIPFVWMLSDVIVPPTAVMMLAIVLRYVDHATGRRSGLPALPLLFLGLAYVHPHDCLPLGLTVTLCELTRVRHPRESLGSVLKLPAAVAAGLLLPAAHYLLILQRDPYLWGYVGLQDGYRVLDLLLAYPWHLLTATGWLIRPPNAADRRFAIPGVWLLVASSLLLLPTTLGDQHYLLHGIPFAASLLAVEGARRWTRAPVWARLPALGRRLPAGVLACLLLATSTFVYARDVRRGLRAYRGWYLPDAYFEAFAWLRAHAKSDDTAVASGPIAEQLTRFVGMRVRAAMPEQTADYEAAMRRQEAWLEGRPEARSWLRGTAASWLVLARAFPSAPERLPPGAGDRLRRVFANELVTIYHVSPQ